MMKKLFASLLAVLMIASLAACGGAPANSPAPTSPASPSEPSTSAAPETSSSQPEASTPAGEIVMPTYPDASTVDLAKLDAEIKELAAKVKTISDGKLVLGTSADYAPYEFHIQENGVDKIVGFDIALAQAIADELGVELEIKDIPFDSILLAISADSDRKSVV